MKNLFIRIAALIMLTMLVSGMELMAQNPKEKEVVKIQTNLDCDACKKKIENYMAFEKGVTSVSADVKTKVVTIEYRTRRTNEEKMVGAIEKLGYEAKVIAEKPDNQ